MIVYDPATLTATEFYQGPYDPSQLENIDPSHEFLVFMRMRHEKDQRVNLKTACFIHSRESERTKNRQLEVQTKRLCDTINCATVIKIRQGVMGEEHLKEALEYMDSISGANYGS